VEQPLEELLGMETLLVLFVSANPLENDELVVDTKLDEIQRWLEQSEYSDAVEVIPVPETRDTDVVQTLNLHAHTLFTSAGTASKSARSC